MLWPVGATWAGKTMQALISILNSWNCVTALPTTLQKIRQSNHLGHQTARRKTKTLWFAGTRTDQTAFKSTFEGPIWPDRSVIFCHCPPFCTVCGAEFWATPGLDSKLPNWCPVVEDPTHGTEVLAMLHIYKCSTCRQKVSNYSYHLIIKISSLYSIT